MAQIIGLDFETYGAVNLPKHGLDRYVNDDTFTPLIARTYYRNGNAVFKQEYDFVADMDLARENLRNYLDRDIVIAAHNAPFEQAVLGWLGIAKVDDDFLDTAVLARMRGAGGKLEAAAPQLLGVDKMAEGWDLIKLFSMPGKLQEANGSDMFDPDIVDLYPVEWETFGEYCYVDAELSHDLAEKFQRYLTRDEALNVGVTNAMNLRGWPVDLDKVHVMQARHEENVARELTAFYDEYESGVEEDKRLNFNSFPQLKEWCAQRGVKAKSFDELHVTKMLAALEKKIGGTKQRGLPGGYVEVHHMLQVKQLLGGSSLSKLQTIIDMTSPDGRLRNQYLHIGAGQTWRTSGRGVQLQNLKRLNEPIDMDTLDDVDVDLSSGVLAENIRQLFTASRPDGRLLVGDFASVESRGLGWLARADWKTAAFRNNKDMYKVLASKMFNTEYDDVTKAQRQTGKVGELSCGYGAGPDAVKDFAEKMGVEFTPGEAGKLVMDWRDTNPEVLALWQGLDSLLLNMVHNGRNGVLPVGSPGFTVEIVRIETPYSLHRQHPGALSIEVRLLDPNGIIRVQRVFHGCYVRGRGVGYYKPSERKTGDLWKNGYVNPKTKQFTFYTIYGGKLTGILTQSLCREMFFHSLRVLEDSLRHIANMEIIGQFHDEIVCNWWPVEDKHDPDWSRSLRLDQAAARMHAAMTDAGPYTGFPLAAEIKSDYRYTK